MRDLILGSTFRLGERQLLPFLDSLKETKYRGEVVFFVSVNEPQISRFLQEKQIRVCFFDETLYSVSIHVFRYFLYQKFLRTVANKYDRVMITDVRDVLFQRDPFDFDMSSLNVFLEDVTIGRCPYNSKWIGLRFGFIELIHLYNCTVSCSGVTIGRTQEMLEYLELMIRFLNPTLNVLGYDQGVHNFLLHNHYIEPKAFNNRSGPVLTMGYAKKIRVSTEGLVLNEDGLTVNIIHQYDRGLREALSNVEVAKRFIPKVTRS